MRRSPFSYIRRKAPARRVFTRMRGKVSCEATGDAVTVRLGGREGSFEPERSETRIELRGIEREPGKVSVDGGEASFEYGGNRLVITFAERVDGTVIEVGV
jgi:hypothetical protein